MEWKLCVILVFTQTQMGYLHGVTWMNKQKYLNNENDSLFFLRREFD